jgi:hypothetical protein
MDNLNIWKAGNDKLISEINKLIKERGGKICLNIRPSKINELKYPDFSRLFVRLESELGIDSPMDYKRYLGEKYNKMPRVANHMKLKYLLVTYNNKISCDLSKFPIKKIVVENPKPRVLPDLSKQTVPEDQLKSFYRSAEWKKLRYEAIRKYGQRCACCGAKPSSENNVILNVDHIKPLRYNWSIRLDIDNMQVLCADCNRGKGSIYEDVWRE